MSIDNFDMQDYAPIILGSKVNDEERKGGRLLRIRAQKKSADTNYIIVDRNEGLFFALSAYYLLTDTVKRLVVINTGILFDVMHITKTRRRRRVLIAFLDFHRAASSPKTINYFRWSAAYTLLSRCCLLLTNIEMPALHPTLTFNNVNCNRKTKHSVFHYFIVLLFHHVSFGEYRIFGNRINQLYENINAFIWNNMHRQCRNILHIFLAGDTFAFGMNIKRSILRGLTGRLYLLSVSYLRWNLLRKHKMKRDDWHIQHGVFKNVLLSHSSPRMPRMKLLFYSWG